MELHKIERGGRMGQKLLKGQIMRGRSVMPCLIVAGVVRHVWSLRGFARIVTDNNAPGDRAGEDELLTVVKIK